MAPIFRFQAVVFGGVASVVSICLGTSMLEDGCLHGEPLKSNVDESMKSFSEKGYGCSKA